MTNTNTKLIQCTCSIAFFVVLLITYFGFSFLARLPLREVYLVIFLIHC